MINKLLNINLLNFYLFIGTLFSFLLWEFASVIAPSKIYINNFFKFSLILFLPLCFIKFKKINILILFSIIFFLQEILIKYYHNIENFSNLRHYFSIFFFLSFIIVVKKFHKKIFIYTIKIIDYFILFFIFSSLFFLLITNKIILDREGCSIVYIKFKFLFTENSHIAFVLPSILFYSLWRVTNLFNFFNFLISFSTFFLSIFYLSLSMIIGVLIAYIVIFLSSYRILNVKFKIFSLFITFIFIMLLIYKPTCHKRILDLHEGLEINKIYELKSPHDKKNFINDSFNANINFSSKVYLDSINTSLKSILNYPFGAGLNNFQLLSDRYMLRIADRDINAHSGRSILLKIITEFGIFSLIFFIMLLIMTFSNRIMHTKKIFFLPIIFIQLINGEGYFNGFFLISLFILYFSYGDKKFFSWR